MSDTTSRKTDQELWQILHDLIGEYGFGATPKDDQDLVEFGFDDLDEIEFGMAVEETFNVAISDEDLAKLKTLNEYFTYLRNHGV